MCRVAAICLGSATPLDTGLWVTAPRVYEQGPAGRCTHSSPPRTPHPTRPLARPCLPDFTAACCAGAGGGVQVPRLVQLLPGSSGLQGMGHGGRAVWLGVPCGTWRLAPTPAPASAPTPADSIAHRFFFPTPPPYPLAGLPVPVVWRHPLHICQVRRAESGGV